MSHCFNSDIKQHPKESIIKYTESIINSIDIHAFIVEGSYKSSVVNVLWWGLETCWHESVYIKALCHRFWKLTLQVNGDGDEDGGIRILMLVVVIEMMMVMVMKLSFDEDGGIMMLVMVMLLILMIYSE